MPWGRGHFHPPASGAALPEFGFSKAAFTGFSVGSQRNGALHEYEGSWHGGGGGWGACSIGTMRGQESLLVEASTLPRAHDGMWGELGLLSPSTDYQNNTNNKDDKGCHRLSLK